MHKLLAIVAAAALTCAWPAFGQTTKAADAKPANSQQNKMTTCNEKAGDKKGDDRKAFMKTCLSAKAAEPAKAESRMAMCNKKTAGMKAEERAKAQSECMKAA